MYEKLGLEREGENQETRQQKKSAQVGLLEVEGWVKGVGAIAKQRWGEQLSLSVCRIGRSDEFQYSHIELEVLVQNES